ncbi:MAG: ATP-grasp fold amidoligase family protein [Trueperaceae bacterium]
MVNPYRSARAVARSMLDVARNTRRKAAVPRDSASEPTFGDFIDRRHEWLFAHLPEASAAYLHDLHAKDKQKALARRLGLSVADEYVSHVPLADALEFITSTPVDHVVLKPVAAKSGNGVFCIVKEDGRYRDLRSEKRFRLDRLRQEAHLSYAKLRRPDAWMVEELLLPADGSIRIIDEVKAHCFGGRTELIMQKGEVGGGKRGLRFYDRDWQPVTTGRRTESTIDELTPPPNGAALVEVAERAATQIPMPFMRVDLYDTSRGVVLGEFTPGPGGRHAFNAEWTERLTRSWREAAKRLEAALANGEMQPLLPDAQSFDEQRETAA